MPKGTLTFKLPEEHEEFVCAQEGLLWKHLVIDVLSHLRAQIKHGQIADAKAAAFEEVRELIWNSIEDRKLKAD